MHFMYISHICDKSAHRQCQILQQVSVGMDYLDSMKKKLIILTKRGHRSHFAEDMRSVASNASLFKEPLLDCDSMSEVLLSHGFEKLNWAPLESERK